MGGRSEAFHDFPIDAKAFYDAIVHSTEDYIYIVDMKTGEALISENMLRDFELPGRIVEGLISVWGALLHERDRRRFFENAADLRRGRTDEHSMEYQVRNRKNEYVWVACRGLVNQDKEGKPAMFAGVITPIGSKGRLDSTTGLFTQVGCKKSVEALLERGRIPSGILLLGIDDFRRINNLKDHIFGDSVLRKMAQSLQRLLPPEASIFRFDGDQFAVVCPGADQAALEDLYQAIHLYANREHKIDGTAYFCSLSGGIAVLGRDSDNYLDLIKNASSALEASKKGGKNTCTVFTPELLESNLRAMGLASLLQRSVANGMERFSLVYQPFVSADGLRLKGAEALLRWSCPEYGSVTPTEFIPLLESNGLIIPVGTWVLEQAVATCARWIPGCPAFVMNINVSYLQILEDDFVPFVASLLERHQLDASHIVLELTESYFVTDMTALQEAFRKLRALDIRIAMDDFGTGYSSLGMLSQTPADIVKIDRLFVSLINDQEHRFNRSFIGAVIQLCHSVGITVCVEGVEYVDELKTVRSLDADSIQGYYVSKPIPPERFEEKYLAK